MALTAIVTNAGRAALVNAANTGTAPVTIAQVGLTATAVVPGVGITALPGEYKRIATISGDVVADDTIHLIVRDESADVFTVRSFALYLADGTLFAIYGQAGVILEKSAQAMMLLAIDVQFADVAAAMLTFGNANFLNPPATTEMQGVVELATVGEAQAGIDALRALTPAAAKAAILGWLLAQDGSGSGLDADLLDGQDGSYYTNIPGRLGYTPVNKAGDTLTGNLAIAKTGSQELHFSGTGNYKWRAIGLNAAGSGGSLTLQYTADNFAASFVNGLVLTTGGVASSQGQGTFWGANNDGAGSGLDADLLDGQEGSYYSNITARLGYTPLNKAGDTVTGNLSIDGELTLSGTGDTGYINRPNVTGKKKISFTVQGGGNLEEWKVWSSIIQFNGNTAWHAGNDGAGSGLDADLLDGQDSTYFTNITARLGYTPVNKAGDTNLGPMDFLSSGAFLRVGGAEFIWSNGTTLNLGNSMSIINIKGNTAWHAGNDGAGSGLDADLLDGQDSAYYTNITARLGYTPANKAGENFTGYVTVGYNAEYAGFALKSTYGNASRAAHAFLDYKNENDVTLTNITNDILTDGSSTLTIQTTPSGSRTADRRQVAAILRGPGRAHDFYAASMWLNGNRVWDASSDGSGSGLDADLLDGYQATDFNRITQSNLTANGGRRVHSDGYIEHWGVDTTRRTGENSFYFAFPTPFPNECFGVDFTTINTALTNSGDTHLQEVSITKDGFTVYTQSDTTGQGDFWGFRWKAHGR